MTYSQTAADAFEALVELAELPRSNDSARLAHVVDFVHRQVPKGVPKTVAAQALGISVTALDRWIERGRVKTVSVPGTERRAVDLDALVALVGEVRKLRALGQDRHLLAAAIAKLEVTEDPEWREGIVAGLRAIADGDLVPVRIPDEFGPED